MCVNVVVFILRFYALELYTLYVYTIIERKYGVGMAKRPITNKYVSNGKYGAKLKRWAPWCRKYVYRMFGSWD
jgi:hypothetical protein